LAAEDQVTLIGYILSEVYTQPEMCVDRQGPVTVQPKPRQADFGQMSDKLQGVGVQHLHIVDKSPPFLPATVGFHGVTPFNNKLAFDCIGAAMLEL
jgi:hypothetical protein